MSSRPERQIVRLACGLVVIAQHIPVTGVASVQCWVKAGPLYEGALAGTGVSHFLEHLVFGGSTSTRTASTCSEILTRVGARINAITGLDTVHYYIDTAATDVPVAIELLSDWMQHARITAEEFALQREVIKNELETSRGEPGWILWKLTQNARYPNHPARHPTLGYLDEFLTLRRDDVHRFYETMYVPNNMVLVVTGDIDPERVVAQVSAQWTHATPRPIPALLLPVAAQLDSPRYLRGYAAVERPRLRLAWPGTRLGASGDHALDVLARVLGQGTLGRLARTVRDAQRLASSAEAYNLSFPWGDGFFGVDAMPTSPDVDAVQAAILAQVELVQAEGVTADELMRARRKLVSTAFYAAQTVRGAASRIARDFLQSGDPDYLHHYATSIQRIGADEVHAAAVRYLRPDRLITIHLLPQHAGQPQDLSRRPPSDGPEPVEMERVVFDTAVLMHKMRSLGPVATDRAARPSRPPHCETLANGLRVIVQRNPSLPIVAMQWHQVGGVLADHPGREGIANAVAAMMTRGAGGRSASDISRTLEEIGASLIPACTHSTSSVSGECLEGDWKTVLELMSDVIQRPLFPESEWINLQPRLKTAIAIQNETWHGHVHTCIRDAYFDSDHPWSRTELGRIEVIAGLHSDDLTQFHADHLAARDGVLAIFGDVDADEVFAEVARRFGGMRERPVTPCTPPICGPIQPRRVIVASDKPMVAVQLAYGPGMTRRCLDYAALLVMNRVLDSPPGGWLNQELSGRGLVYALGVGMMTGTAPGYWGLMFNCGPENVQEATERALGVVARIRSELLDPATLERAKTGALLSEALGMQSNAQRARMVALDELIGLGFDNNLEVQDALGSITTEKVRDAALRYLETLVSVQIGPRGLTASD